ncbi:MAG: hypothetical protein WBQ94_09280 [Terracidiphilus sp.]
MARLNASVFANITPAASFVVVFRVLIFAVIWFHPNGNSMRILVLWILLVVTTLPACAAERVTVAQLEQKLAAQPPPGVVAPLEALRDDQLAQLVAELTLTERLSDARLELISQKLQPGRLCKQALQVLAYRSAFLDPPTDELPSLPPPDADTQKRLITTAGAHVLYNLKHLPNFFATRATTHYSGVPADMNQSPLLMRVGVFLLGASTHEITFRNGEEVIDPMNAESAEPGLESGLETWGEFGPQPAVILVDAAQSSTSFHHWEKTPTGLVAVFHYSVPRVGSHYEVNYKCPTNEPFHDSPAYHGSFSIDPASGALMRITLQTEGQPDDPISHVASIVEYSPIEIGERRYICPVRSIATMVEESNACAARHHNPKLAQPILMLNQTSFTSYHRLGSTSRIVSDGANAPAPPVKNEK